VKAGRPKKRRELPHRHPGNIDYAPDWSTGIHSIEAVFVARTELRTGVAGIALRCIDNAAERAQHLGKGEPTKTSGEQRKDRQREREEMLDWLAEDDHDGGRAFSLGWCCTVLESHIGCRLDRVRIGQAIAGLLAGSRHIRRQPTHKKPKRRPLIFVLPSESAMQKLP
jgi:hypothetical protein